MRPHLLVAALLSSAGALTAAERSALPALPTAAQVQQALAPLTPLKAAALADAQKRRQPVPAVPHDQIRIDVWGYSDGSFNVSEPFEARIDLRGYKPFSNEYDYQLSGRIGDEMVIGDARTKVFSDPTMGYILNSHAFYATLEPFGSGWILQGNYLRKFPNGASRREHFRYDIRRDFFDRYSIVEPGLDLRLRVDGFSASVEGRYDKQLVGATPLALVGTVAGILSQPRLRQDPRRP